MEKTLWKNLLILGASVILVLTFMLLFSLLYDKVRIKPSCELKDYKIKVEILNKDGSKFQPDSCQYIIKPEPHYTENPIEANDYSSFLVSFISVLATFVVIANFANAKDLITSSENAENAKKAAETAKTDSETIKTEVAGQITVVNNILTDINNLKTAVEQTKNNADESLNKASLLIAEQKEAIEEQFNKLRSEISEAQTLFTNHKTDIDTKQNGLFELYNEVKLQIERFEKEVSGQRAEITAAVSKIAAVENQVSDLKNSVITDNTLEEQKQLDAESSNQTMPISIEINNDNKEV